MTRIGASLRTLDWGRLFAFSLLGTLVKIVVELILKRNPFSFGAVLLPHAEPPVQTLVGVLVTVGIEQVYGLLFVVLFVPVQLWDRFTRAVLGSFFLNYLSILIMKGAPAVDWQSAWPRALEFLVFALPLSFLYRSKQPDGQVEGPLP